MTKAEALEFISSIAQDMRKAKTKWYDPEEVDDSEEICTEYPMWVGENADKMEMAVAVLKGNPVVECTAPGPRGACGDMKEDRTCGCRYRGKTV